MKFISIVLAFLIIAFNVSASDETIISKQNFEINAPKHAVLDIIENKLKYPTTVLEKYRPVGAIISNKKVSLNTLSFNATKKFLFLSETIFIKTIIDYEKKSKICGSNDGFILRMSFDGSDSLITDNVDGVNLYVCPTSNSSTNQASVSTFGSIEKGPNFSVLVGPKIIQLIKAQVNPIIKALKADLEASNLRETNEK